MPRKLFFHVSESFEESDETMRKYYSSLTPAERLDTAQYLREQFLKVKGKMPARMDKTSFKAVIRK